MLILSRRPNEEIVIGDNSIIVVVLQIRGRRVRLGVEAPDGVPVHRREVFDAIRRNEASAADKTGESPPSQPSSSSPLSSPDREKWLD